MFLTVLEQQESLDQISKFLPLKKDKEKKKGNLRKYFNPKRKSYDTSINFPQRVRPNSLDLPGTTQF